jgi:hypothetical protein
MRVTRFSTHPGAVRQLRDIDDDPPRDEARVVYSFAGSALGVFLGARVARQPTTTNAIRAATKIPNCSMSTMLILHRPEWGGIRSCEVTLAA